MIAIVVSEKEEVRERMGRALEGFEVINCINFLDAVYTVSQNKNGRGLMFADFNLRQYNGVELLKISKVINSHIQSVLMIKKTDEEAEIEGVQSEIDLIIEYEKADSVNRAYIDRLVMQYSPVLPTFINKNELTVKGISVKLAKKEMMIVSILIDKNGEIVNREEITQRIWQSTKNVRKVDIHVKAIRTKFAEAGLPELIITVRGEGYYWSNSS